MEQDVDLTADDLAGLVETYKGIYRDAKGEDFPQEPRAQLDAAISAVFESWDNKRAHDYRRLNRIPYELGTAVNVQQMVFGNTGPTSGTGVAFTRNNVTGEKAEPFGDFLINAQGEDVVAGIRTPRPLAELKGELPEAFAQLIETMDLLEQTYRNMQDVEFTIEDGALYMLQTRNGKRSAQAMARIAVDLVAEGVVTEDESLVQLVDADQVRQLLLPQLDLRKAPEPLATGVAASPGAATGTIVFTADEAERLGTAGDPVILVRDETTPDDFHGMVAAQGILTARGGKTSHAAIVAVGMGTPAVCGVTAIKFLDDGTITIAGESFREGDRITIDGTSGSVFPGDAPLLPPDPDNPYLVTILGWADRVRRLKVRTNADTPDDAARAREFGAEGIGLCRTEHMFQGEDRLPIVQSMIMAEDAAERVEFLHQLRAFQQSDFEGIFRAMAGLPVTIRLLDPPLHEFLPDLVELSSRVAVAKATGHPDPEAEAQLRRVQELHEVNPMLGTRGCRLGIEWPDVYRMQVAAIMNAACVVKADAGDAPLVEIMIPLVGFEDELRIMREQVVDVAETVLRERGAEVEYTVGTMIELPRAALRASTIAQQADFFSFGTNDLTQTTLGFSRDDAETKFLAFYLANNVIAYNPFETIDQPGVGRLVEMADRGRARGEAGHQAGHLRRARRRPHVGGVLPPRRARLRVVLAVPRPDRADRRGPRGPRRRLGGPGGAGRRALRARLPRRPDGVAGRGMADREDAVRRPVGAVRAARGVLLAGARRDGRGARRVRPGRRAGALPPRPGGAVPRPPGRVEAPLVRELGVPGAEPPEPEEWGEVPEPFPDAVLLAPSTLRQVVPVSQAQSAGGLDIALVALERHDDRRPDRLHVPRLRRPHARRDADARRDRGGRRRPALPGGADRRAAGGQPAPGQPGGRAGDPERGAAADGDGRDGARRRRRAADHLGAVGVPDPPRPGHLR